MAEYIKFRMTAAKVGVSMAFFALLGGLADRARAATPTARPPASASASFLQEISTPTGGGLDRVVIQKLDRALATLEHKLAKSFYTSQKINKTFLKIKSANSEFLKVKSANTEFLKIEDANTFVFKVIDANTEFLKIDDANADFLKVRGTAANSSELGGLTPDAFFQGHGNVLSNEVTATASGGQAQLLGDGSLTVLVADTVGNGAQVTLQNETSSALSYTESNNQSGTVPANGQSTPISITAQLELQVFSAAAPSKVWTITVSTVPGGGGDVFVGQMLIGLL